jgi:hypothetical protein
VHAAHAEVAQLVLVGDPDDLRLVAHLAGSQVEFEVDDVLERRSFAGAGAVADADEEALPLTAAHSLDRLVERGRGLEGVLDGADRQAVAIWAETCGLVEAQPRPGGVDQEVVPDFLGAARHPLDDDIRSRVTCVALWVDLACPGLLELDAVALVDRREREPDLVRPHQADADPDVGRDPVVGVVGRDDRHGVIPA